MDPIKVILFLTIGIITDVVNVGNDDAGINYDVNVGNDDAGIRNDDAEINYDHCIGKTSSGIFEHFYSHVTIISSPFYKQGNLNVITEYRDDVYYRVMLALNEHTFLLPTMWCEQKVTSDASISSCKKSLNEIVKDISPNDGRHFLRYFFYNTVKSDLRNNQYKKGYSEYILQEVKTLIQHPDENIPDIIQEEFAQSSSQNCSEGKKPDIENEKLAQSSLQNCSDGKKPDIEKEDLAQSSSQNCSDGKKPDIEKEELIQTVSQYCSQNRKPAITPSEHEQLSNLGPEVPTKKEESPSKKQKTR